MDGPRVIGVRHHSPACARLVRAEIERLRPRTVLIEAPADLDVAALTLPHRLPVAALSWAEADGWSVASWTPFCEHSPEHVALREGLARGAEVRFIDLPAWTSPFAVRTPKAPIAYERALLDRVLADDGDALWDHLFEQGDEGLAARLDAHWDALRGARAPDARERFMAAHVAHAMGEARGPVLVVCGGLHAPHLRSGWRDESGARPSLPPFEGIRRGIELVPWSDARLAGYAAGMPAPGWDRAVWEEGPERASARLLAEATTRVRRETAPSAAGLGAADVIAAETMMRALARLRGHAAPTRSDFLDAVVATWVKTPLRRGLPAASADDPILRAILDALRGDRVGELAPGLAAPALVLEARSVARDRDEAGLRRLAALRTPGVSRDEAGWKIDLSPASEAHLARESGRGPTLAAAAADRAREALEDGERGALATALRLGLDEDAAPRLHAAAAAAIERLSSLADAGDALRAVTDGGPPSLVAAALARVAWLLEACRGPRSEAEPEGLAAVRAVRDALDVLRDAAPGTRDDVRASLRRVAHDGRAPWPLRGACLGVLGEAPAFERLPPEAVGRVLHGILDAARDPASEARRLLDALDAFVTGAPEEALVEALPGLRLALARLPRADRADLAHALARRHEDVRPDPAVGAAIEAAVDAALAREAT